MSAKTQIDNFIRTYPEAILDPVQVITIHSGFPNNPAYFRLSPVIGVIPCVDQNGTFSYDIFSRLRIPPNTDLSITVKSLLDFVTPYYKRQSISNPVVSPVTYQPSVIQRNQSFDINANMTLTPTAQEISIKEYLLPSNISYDQINTSLCTPEELNHLITNPTETGIIFKHVKPFSIYYDKYIFLRHNFYRTNQKNIKLIEEIKQLQNQIQQLEYEINNKIQQYNASTADNNQQKQQISPEQQCNNIINQERENCNYIIKQISSEMSDIAIKNLCDQYLEHSVNCNKTRVIQQLVRPQVLEFRAEGEDVLIKVDKDEFNNLLNEKRNIKVPNSQDNINDDSNSNMDENNRTVIFSKSILDGTFSDGQHIWKCYIALSDYISTFSYEIESRNCKLYEELNLVPKYDGGICKFSVNPQLPEGLSIDENTGIISGRCLIDSNITKYTITCQNNKSQNQTELTLSVGVLTKFSYPKDNILSGKNYTLRLEPEYDGENCEFSSTPNLPDGIYLDPKSGVISGTFNNSQEETKYIIACKNNTGEKHFQLIITVISLTRFEYDINDNKKDDKENITDNNAKRYLLNDEVSLKPIVDSPNCTFTIDKELPNGLVFDPSTGIISGICKELAKEQIYTITCNNGFTSLQTTIKLSVGDLRTFSYPQYLIKLKKEEEIELIPDYDGEMCSFYILNKEGGDYSNSNCLFEGIELNPSTGVIKGKCNSIHKSKEFTIICSNSTASLDYKITISVGELSLFKYEKSVIEINKLEEIHLVPQYEGDDCTFTVNKKLPFGLALNSKTGEISGKCKKDKDRNEYIITCDNGIDRIDFKLEITVSSISFIKYDQEEFFLHVNEEYVFIPTHDGFNCCFSSDSELPEGLTLNETTGIISGKCLTAQDCKEYVICCENEYNAEICTVKIAVGVLKTFSYPKYDIYLNSDEEIEMIPECDGDNCEFSVEPELPNGITINKNSGVISGKCEYLQHKTIYTVKCVDLINTIRVMTYEINITIGEIISFLYPTYDYHFSTEDKEINIVPKELIGSKCYIYSIPELPNGLILNSENGIISGECCDEVIKDKLFTIYCKNDISQRDYGIHITTVKPIAYFIYNNNKYRYYGIVDDDIHIEAEYDGSDCRFYIAEGNLPSGLSLDEVTGNVDGKFEEVVDDLRCKIICENEFSKRDYILEFDVSPFCLTLPSS